MAQVLVVGWLCCVIVQWQMTCVQTVTVGEIIFNEIKNFSDTGVGATAFQNYLKNQVKTISNDVNANTVKKLALGINDKLQGYAVRLKELQSEIKKQYTGTAVKTTDDTNCKDISNPDNTLLYGQNVNFNKWCLAGNALNDPTAIEGYLSRSELFPKWKSTYYDNAFKKGIKYIKYGDENGVLYNYPAKKFNDHYDNRFSTWYAEAATPMPKDVVVMIDQSQTMKSSMPIAKEIGLTVINTMNLNDRIAILSFGEQVQMPSGTNGKECYSKELAKATDVNKDNLKAFITEITASASSRSFTKALIAGFTLFNNTSPDIYDSRARQRVVLFITDGGTDEKYDDVINTLKEENKKFTNKIAILTFGVGSDLRNEDLLRKLAGETTIRDTNIPRASFTNVKEIKNVRQAMSSYYNYLKHSSDIVIYSAPYKDVFASGLLISMCEAVSHLSQLKGVFCFDMSIEYLLSDVTFFRDDDGAYAFLIDAQARVLSHPMLPNVAQLAKEAFFVFLPTVEIADNIETIQSKMTSEESGKEKTKKLQLIPRGSGGGQEVLTKDQEITYYWHQVKDPKFSVCIVAARNVRETIQKQFSPIPIWYHTDYKVQSTGLLCQSFRRIAATRRISLILTSACFVDPFHFVYFNEPSLNQITSFLKQQNAQNPGIKNGIRDTASAILPELESLWQNALHSDYIIWRYYGTGSGLVLVYPGLELPRLYDARIRPWFLGAVADKSKLYITTPYEDVWGAGIVISLTQATKKNSNFTVGVIAMDLTIASLYYTVTRKLPQCSKHTCIVINSAGFIIVHKDWIKSSTTKKEVEDIHLVQKDPYIADRLIKEEIFQRKNCTDLSNSFQEKNYWQVVLKQDMVFGNNFNITEIPGTNLYLITKLNDPGKITDCDKHCSSTCPSLVTCHCPCVKDTSAYEYCTGSLNTKISLPCAPKLPATVSNILEEERQRMNHISLKGCTDYKCDSRPIKNQCLGVLSCSWCAVPYNNTLCEYCGSDTTCSNGVTKCAPSKTPSESLESPESDIPDVWLRKWEFAVIFIFMLVIFGGVSAIIILLIYRRFKKSEKDENYNQLRFSRMVVRPDEQPNYTNGRANDYQADNVQQNNARPPRGHAPPRPPQINGQPVQPVPVNQRDVTTNLPMTSHSFTNLSTAQEPNRLSNQYQDIDRGSYITPKDIKPSTSGHQNSAFDQNLDEPTSGRAFDPFEHFEPDAPPATVVITTPDFADAADLE